MIRNNFVIAIGFGVITFISLILQPTAAQAAQQVCCCGATKWDGRKCWWEPLPGECPGVESGRQRWDAGNGQCIDTGSGGVGGGSTDCGPGYSYDPERGCRKIKQIGKSKDQRRAECESRGNQWNSETGRCIKRIGKSKLPPAEQAPEQTQPDASTSGGAGGE
jgi:hypothetical protein